jgi:hypothetical protein
MASWTGWKETGSEGGPCILAVYYTAVAEVCVLMESISVKVLQVIEGVCVIEGAACRRVVVGLPVMLAISEMWWALAELLLTGCAPRGEVLI